MPIYIRSKHHYAFRTGEWAQIQNLELFTPPELTEKLCFRVLYADGEEELIPVYDPDAQLEFSNDIGKWYE